MFNKYIFGLVTLILFAQSESFAAKKWPVRLQLQYFHQFQFAGFYAAQFLGLYEKAGLDVSIMEGNPQQAPVTAVLNGYAEFGVSDTELLWRRLEGAPIVAVGVIFQNSAYSLVTLNSSNIMTLEDLRGKKVGIAEGRGEYMFDALFKTNGLPLDSFQRIRPKWNLQSLLDGATDVNGAYITGEVYRLHEMGLPFQTIYPQDYGVEFYGDTLFTSEKFLDEHPDIVEAFHKATFEGWRYAFEHPERVIDYILSLESVQTRQISRDRLRYEATTMRHLILPNVIELGSMSEKRWRKMAEQLQISMGNRLDFAYLDGFIYQTPAEKRRIWQQYAFAAVAVASVLLLISLLWIVQLRKSVKFRTVALAETTRRAEIHAQEAKDANAAKSMFVASISHEFRTPLTSIIGFAQLLAGSTLTEQQQKWTAIVRARSKDLLGLVNQVLDLIQSEAGRAPQDNVDFNIRQELAELVESCAPIFAEKEISVSFPDLQRGSEADWVHGSARTLRQVLTNLLSNASKFVGEHGHVAIRFEPIACISTQHVSLHFSVEDDGPGIPEQMKETVFEPFKQVREGNLNKDQGSGLGLAICRKLVSALGGSIWIENMIPHGCRVHFTTQFLKRVIMPQRQMETNTKVLIVDDDGVNRELIRTYLAMGGFDITEAASGQNAVKSCEQHEFDFILMDLGLPDLDGVQVTEKIKSSHLSRNRSTPIAALTAAPRQMEQERCLKAGMIAFLPKPVNFDDLVLTIRRLSRGI